MDSNICCEQAFDGVLGSMHNQCLYSNALYALGGVFGVVALPGWWKLLGCYIFAVAAVSYVHHTNERAVLGTTFWNRLDRGLASAAVIVGAGALVGFIASPDTRALVDPYLCSLVFLLAIYSLVVFYLSQKASAKAGGRGDTKTDWGSGLLLAQNTNMKEAVLLPPPEPCAKQRYQVDYLALHSAWHGLSAVAIILMLAVLNRALHNI